MKRRRLLASLFALAIVFALAAVRVADPYPVAVLRDISFDFFQRLHPRPAGDFPVRVVDIDEASLRAIGQWPWPRATMARLDQRLAELGAAAIAFDVLFPEADRTDPAGDDAFAAALAASPAVLGFSDAPEAATLPPAPKSGFAVSGESPIAALPLMTGAAVPLPKLLEAAPGLGSVSLNASDRISDVRRVPLLWTDGTQIFPTLSVEALRIALGVSTLVVMGETGGPGYVDSLRIGPLQVPTTSSGDLWIHYRIPDPSLYVSAATILGDGYEDAAPLIAGSIVLIGASASGLVDIHGTPLGNLPGVAIHAQAIEQMLSGSFLQRSDWVLGLELIGFVVSAAFLVLVVLRLGPRAGLLGGAGIVAGIVGFCWYMFTAQGIMIDPSFPVIGATLSYTAAIFFQFMLADADKREIRRAFGHYVSPALLAEIERTGSLTLGGEIRDITIMFSDVRGFTPLSEVLPPKRMLAVLNTLFGALGAEILARSGTIDKFVGDAIMAFWNAPIDVPDHCRLACEAALAMRRRIAELNATDGFGLKAERGPAATLAAGIGISTGAALVGNMGLESRFDYSCIGDPVNTASRVESGCKEVRYDVLVTGAVRQAAPGLAYLYGGALAMKGKSQRQPVFLLVGDAAMAASPAFAELLAAHEAVVARLAARRPADAEIARCRDIAATVDPALGAFYDGLPGRADDFAAAPVAAAPAAVAAPERAPAHELGT